jgi:hypothetical protein
MERNKMKKEFEDHDYLFYFARKGLKCITPEEISFIILKI